MTTSARPRPVTITIDDARRVIGLHGAGLQAAGRAQPARSGRKDAEVRAEALDALAAWIETVEALLAVVPEAGCHEPSVGQPRKRRPRLPHSRFGQDRTKHTASSVVLMREFHASPFGVSQDAYRTPVGNPHA